jgi:hypothetical protein
VLSTDVLSTDVLSTDVLSIWPENGPNATSVVGS